MTKLENRCPHGISVVDIYGRERLVERTGPPVRIETVSGDAIGVADGIARYASPAFKAIAHLPPYRDGVILIVSQLVARAVSCCRNAMTWSTPAPRRKTGRAAIPARASWPYPA
jgi:hypothetical protein